MSTTSLHPLIRAVEEADSPSRLVAAVRNLADAQLEEGIPTLIATLGFNNPGAAIVAIDGLVKLGDVAVQPLLQLLDGYNYGARAWAIRALSQIGHPLALDTLLDAVSNDFALSVRRSAAKGLGDIRWHLLPQEEIETAQSKALEALISVSHDPEWVVRYAAIVAMQHFAQNRSGNQAIAQPRILTQLHHILETETDLTVRARTYVAIQDLTKE